MIVKETNRYAREVMGDEKYEAWRTIDTEELQAFWGFCILMGVVHLPSLDDYWSRDPLTHYAPIAMKIPRWRFRENSRYLHFVNNQHLAQRGSPTFDRLGKVRPLIDHLSLQFTALYNPSKNVAVDEAMIKFQGRSALKQYMPMKPIKRGIKVWVLGDSTNGYFSRFEVYTGKKDTRQVGLGEHVVKTLTSELKGKNHHVYFDNFFTSVKLLEDLLEDGIYGCGTARKDRKGFPPALKTVSLKQR
ncbi:piggyBac transposable element-derived protein 4-like [Halichondria panicea]|uniref:piggyBac transposable element-derived protein 4-like n=1 Tax=Halichondria panicea TaxID=6063 RepID=UPI00312B9192